MFKAADSTEFSTKEEADAHDHIIAVAESVISTVLNGTGVGLEWNKDSKTTPYTHKFTAGLVRAFEHQSTRAKIVELLQITTVKG